MIADVEPSVIAISIHALRVEGDDEEYINQICDYNISIHALRVEGDTSLRTFANATESKFLSTPSGWRATTQASGSARLCYRISIHALRVEGDRYAREVRLRSCYFYPRPPGGGRHLYGYSRESSEAFLSTPSGWRATPLYLTQLCTPTAYFYPRPPGGGRQGGGAGDEPEMAISIHALRVEGDMKANV